MDFAFQYVHDDSVITLKAMSSGVRNILLKVIQNRSKLVSRRITHSKCVLFYIALQNIILISNDSLCRAITSPTIFRMIVQAL